TVPGGHMRGPGRAQTTFALECHLDLCARALGLDPLELRVRNAHVTPRHTRTGEPGSVPKSREVLRAAGAAIGWDQPQAPGVGRLTRIGNRMIELLGDRLLTRLGTLVASELGVADDDIVPEPGGLRIAGDRFLSLADAMKLAGEELSELIAYERDPADGVHA